MIHQPQQYGRIRNDDGYLSLQPVNSMRLLRYERFLVLIAAVQKVELSIPHKFLCMLRNILREHTGFLEFSGDLPRCGGLASAGAAIQINGYRSHLASLLSLF